MARNNKLHTWLNNLRILIDIAEECEKKCPMKHRLQATARGIEILIKKEKESNDSQESNNS